MAKKQLLEAGKGLLEKTAVRGVEKALQGLGVDKETTKKMADGYKTVMLVKDVAKTVKGLEKSLTSMDSRGMSDLSKTKDYLQNKAGLELTNKLGGAVEDRVKEANEESKPMKESK